MSTYNYQQIVQQTRSMPQWKISLACATCALKVTPILYVLCLPGTRKLVEECLEFAWGFSTAEQPPQEEGVRLARELQLVPEFGCETPDSLVFATSAPLDLVRYAVESVIAKTTLDASNSVGFSVVLEIADSIQSAVDAFPAAVKREIVGAEEASQMSLVDILQQHADPSAELIQALRKESLAIAALISEALPAYCYAFVSELVCNIPLGQQ